MAKVDIILLILLAGGVFAGYRSGIVAMVMTIVALVAGLIVLHSYATDIRLFAGRYVSETPGLYYVIFFVAMAGFMLVGRGISWVIEKTLQLVFLNWVNRLAGAFAGLVFATLVAALLLAAALSLPAGDPLLERKEAEASALFPYMERIANLLPATGFLAFEKTVIRE